MQVVVDDSTFERQDIDNRSALQEELNAGLLGDAQLTGNEHVIEVLFHAVTPQDLAHITQSPGIGAEPRASAKLFDTAQERNNILEHARPVRAVARRQSRRN